MSLLPLVDILLTFQDLDDNNLTVVVKGSTTGDFSGEEFILTPESGDLSHDGRYVSGFTGTLGGITANYVWNAETDLGNGFNGDIHIRGEASDGFTTSFSLVVQQTISINNKPSGAILSAVQRPTEGAIVDILFNLIDIDSDDVTVVIKGSDTGDFLGEEEILTSLDSDILHTLLSIPLPGSPSGEQYNFVWDTEKEYANGFKGCIHLRVFLSDPVDNNVVIHGCVEIDVKYPDTVSNGGEVELDNWKDEDPAYAMIVTLLEPFNLGSIIKNARVSGQVLNDRQVRDLNHWANSCAGLSRVGTVKNPFNFGDVLKDILEGPPFSTTLTPFEIKRLNEWEDYDSSLIQVSTLTSPFKLGDTLNTLLTRRF